ncbi:MAG: hypothetical protein QOH21_2096, partial [Acidobacteriota bacterium]|nr:hypothetical protein [Acidobacteriota bacterium]
MRPLRLLSLVLLLATAFAALALEVPPPPKRWVTDSAGVLSLTALSTLDTKLENF